MLKACVLTTGSNKQTLGFLVTQGTDFDEMRLVFSGALLGANANVLGTTRIYGAMVKSFCAPSPTLDDYTVLANGHPTAHGMGVAVNSDNSGLASTSVLNFSESMDNLIDNDPNNYVELNSTLGISAANPASVSVIAPSYEFEEGSYTGFVIKSEDGPLDAGLLSSINLTTYNEGVKMETVESDNLLNASVLGIDLVDDIATTDGVSVVGFKTTTSFDEVQLSVNSLADVGNTLEVYRAFVTASDALPVTFGQINAVFQNGKLWVDWITEFEKNNKEFVIQGSANGNSWTPLGKVASKANDGNSDVKISYSFTKTIDELLQVSGFSLISAIVLLALIFMLIPSHKRKATWVLTGVFAVAAIAFSCSKSADAYEIPTEQKVKFIRIGQIDKDGTTSYSKAIHIIEK